MHFEGMCMQVEEINSSEAIRIERIKEEQREEETRASRRIEEEAQSVRRNAETGRGEQVDVIA